MVQADAQFVLCCSLRELHCYVPLPQCFVLGVLLIQAPVLLWEGLGYVLCLCRHPVALLRCRMMDDLLCHRIAPSPTAELAILLHLVAPNFPNRETAGDHREHLGSLQLGCCSGLELLICKDLLLIERLT